MGSVVILPARIQEQAIQVVVDTGATSSWIDDKLCSELCLPVYNLPDPAPTWGVGNTSVQPLGKTTAVLNICKMYFPIGLQIAHLPASISLIVGCDWLKRHHSVVDVHANQVLMRSPSAAVPGNLVWSSVKQTPCTRSQSPLEFHTTRPAVPSSDAMKPSTITRTHAQQPAAPLNVHADKHIQPALTRHESGQIINATTAHNNTPRPRRTGKALADHAVRDTPACRHNKGRTAAIQAQLPSVLHRAAHIPTCLNVTLVEMPAQRDIYGRNIVTLADVDLGDVGPHAVPADDLRTLLHQFSDICPADIPPGIPQERWQLGPFHVIPPAPGATPQRGPRYRMSPRERAELDKQTEYLLAQGWIRKSTSPWACSCIFAPKGFQGEDGLRVCQDYRRLNAVTTKNRTPIPRIDDLLDAAAGFTVCSSLDLASGYHQIPLTEDEMHRSAFYGTNDLYEFTVMAFGLTNAPAVFQTAMQRALQGYLGKFVLVYLDDVLVFSKSPSEHLEHLRLVLQRFQQYKLYVRLRKSRFNRQELPYLGHILSPSGVRPDPRKVQLVQDWPSPLTSVKAVEQFLGLANYFRKYIRGFGAVTAPLTRLKRKNMPFMWTDECETSFQYVKDALTSAPVLAPPDTSANAPQFEVICDASGDGIGAALFQDKQVIAFEGRKYRPAECNYTVGEQELLAVVHALQVWRCYLEGAPRFKVITDHNPLVYINTQQHLSRRQSRWVEFMHASLQATWRQAVDVNSLSPTI